MPERNPTYTGTRPLNQVLVSDESPPRVLRPDDSLKLANKSPDGFNWGYGGSGPAQLALALLLDYTGSPEIALAHYQQFKWDKVAGWGDEWKLTGNEIQHWLTAKGVKDSGS